MGWQGWLIVKWSKSKCGYYSVSDCGYTICVSKAPEGNIFTVWAPKTDGNPHPLYGRKALAYFRDGTDAEKVKASVLACEQHYTATSGQGRAAT